MDDDDGLDMDDHAGFDINDPTTLGGIILGGILGSIVLVKTIVYMRQTCCNSEHEMYMGTCGGRGQKGLLTILFLFGLDGWGLYSLLNANDQNYGDDVDDDDDAGSIEAATSDTTATAGVVFCVIALFLWAMMVYVLCGASEMIYECPMHYLPCQIVYGDVIEEAYRRRENRATESCCDILDNVSSRHRNFKCACTSLPFLIIGAMAMQVSAGVQLFVGSLLGIIFCIAYAAYETQANNEPTFEVDRRAQRI